MRRKILFFFPVLAFFTSALIFSDYSHYGQKGPTLEEYGTDHPDGKIFQDYLFTRLEKELERIEKEKVYLYQTSLCYGFEKHPNHADFANSLYESLEGDVTLEFLNSVLEDDRICYNPDILKAKMTWRNFREKINSKESVFETRAFYLKHREFLELTGDKYKVDPEIIVSILKVETDLGKKIDESPPVILTLYNLYFVRKDKPKITKRTRIFINMVIDLGWDPYVGGSREAAVGLPQFMLLPESLYYSADGDCDGKIDLNSVPDSIESVAKYLSLHRYGKRPIADVLYAYNHSRIYGEIVLEHRNLLESAKQESR